MLNQESISQISSRRYGATFRRPDYERYGFNRIPATVRQILTNEDSNRSLPSAALAGVPKGQKSVVVFFIDAFGWRFLESFLDSTPFLKRLEKEGCISKVSSQFPSTTSAHLTTINFDLAVGESGIYEWFYYEPLIGDLLSPLMFCSIRDQRRDGLLATGLTPQHVFPFESIYSQLAKSGVSSFVYQNQNYTPSAYSDAAFSTAQMRPYSSLEHALNQLADDLTTTRKKHSKTYHFLYWDEIDRLGHQKGPFSAPFNESVRTTFSAIETFVRQIQAAQVRDVTMLFIADHGQVEVHPNTTHHLDRMFPDLHKALVRNQDGSFPLVPAGSSRDLFLHVLPESLTQVEVQLREKLAGMAEVHRSEKLIADGIFGPSVTQRLRDRVGNLVVLPYAHQSVWWSGDGKFEHPFFGHHGGLTEAEMDSIFLTLTL